MNNIQKFSPEFWKMALIMYDLEDAACNYIVEIGLHRLRIEDFIAGKRIYGSGVDWSGDFCRFDALDKGAYTTRASTRYIGGVVPMHENAPLPTGTEYFVPDPCMLNGCRRAYWHGTSTDKALMAQGWVFLTSDAAQEFLKNTKPKKGE